MALIGKIAVGLEANSLRFRNEMGRAGRSVNRFTGILRSAKLALTGFGLAIVGFFGVRAITRDIGRLARSMDQIDKASKALGGAQSGATTEFLSGLRFAAEQSGASFEDALTGLTRLVKAVGDTTGNIGEARRGFAALGIDLNEFKRLNIPDQFLALAEAVSQSKASSEQLAGALDLIGRGGGKLLPLLRLGQQGIIDLFQQAGQLGTIVSSFEVQLFVDFVDRVNELRHAWRAMRRVLLASFLPAIIAGIKRLTDFIANNQEAVITWAQTLKSVFFSIAGVIPALLDGIGAALEAFAQATFKLIGQEQFNAIVTAALRIRTAAFQIQNVLTGIESQAAKFTEDLLLAQFGAFRSVFALNPQTLLRVLVGQEAAAKALASLAGSTQLGATTGEPVGADATIFRFLQELRPFGKSATPLSVVERNTKETADNVRDGLDEVASILRTNQTETIEVLI